MKAWWLGVLSFVTVSLIAALPAATAAPGAKSFPIFVGEGIDTRLLYSGDKQAMAKVQTIAKRKHIPNILIAVILVFEGRR